MYKCVFCILDHFDIFFKNGTPPENYSHIHWKLMEDENSFFEIGGYSFIFRRGLEGCAGEVSEVVGFAF